MKNIVVAPLALYILGFGFIQGAQLSTTLSIASDVSAFQATDPGITGTRVIGEVIEVEQSARRIIIKTDAGNTIAIFLDVTTEYLRVPPGEVSLDKAAKIALNEIGLGDKVYARGKLSEDRKTFPAQKIVVMLKADIEKDRERQRHDWQARGIAGAVEALKPNAREIILRVRGREGPKSLTVTTTEATSYRRYAPDSVKFSDAAPSSFTDLKINDQLRALGEKSADGTGFVAEKIVSGSFHTVFGIVTGVGAIPGEIKISTLGKKQPLTIVVTKDSLLQRITPQMGMTIARALGSRKDQRSGDSGSRPTRNVDSPGGDELQRALEHLPTLALADISPGDIVAVASTIGGNPSRLTAVTLVGGLGNVLSAIQSAEGSRNSPSLDIELPAGLLDFGAVRP
jgi:hypothetical protein